MAEQSMQENEPTSDTVAPDEDKVSFGFEDVPRHEKAKKVRGVFDSVASQYDLMNDLMSMGIHRIWKQVLMDRLNPQPGQKLLDVAGGTGDVGIAFLQHAEERAEKRFSLIDDIDACFQDTHATLCDINFEMLFAGTTREDAIIYKDHLTRITGDAEKLPFPDKSFDAYTISFGIRNVTNRENALAEAYRVLKPGGKFYCLEFSHMILESMQKAYDLYSFNVIPKMGEMVTGDRASYQYLIESIRKFPMQEAFAREIREAGFHNVKYENLSAGIAALHSGWRI